MLCLMIDLILVNRFLILMPYMKIGLSMNLSTLSLLVPVGRGLQTSTFGISTGVVLAPEVQSEPV